MPVQVGSQAPPFKAAKAYFAADDQFKDLALDDFRGRWLCLFFYPLAFSPLCPTELVGFNDAAGEFEARNTALLACSIDSHYTLRAWCKSDPNLAALKYPLMSDLTKRIALDYGVLVPDKGMALRGTFLIDPTQKLRGMAVNDFMIGRAIGDILRHLDALQTDRPCPCDWKRGDATM